MYRLKTVIFFIMFFIYFGNKLCITNFRLHRLIWFKLIKDLLTALMDISLSTYANQGSIFTLLGMLKQHHKGGGGVGPIVC